MESDTVAGIAGVAKTIVEAEVPVLIPFDPLITLVMTSVIAHFQATGKWPTAEEVQRSLPADYRKVVAGWDAWKPSGDGSLT